MEILKTIEENGINLYPEDLDFFETELATGNYEPEYIAQCLEKINQLRAWSQGTKEEKEKKDAPVVPKGLVIGIKDLAPAEANPIAASMTPVDVVFSDVKAIRCTSGYKSAFKKYAAQSATIDAEFVDKHFSFFESWEIDAIVSVKQMGEQFIEKYFGAISHDKIARYQMFSESFFMKHFQQLNAEIVLERGKNEWRKKENRSKQLDVFLRLKGVQL